MCEWSELESNQPWFDSDSNQEGSNSKYSTDRIELSSNPNRTNQTQFWALRHDSLERNGHYPHHIAVPFVAPNFHSPLLYSKVVTTLLYSKNKIRNSGRGGVRWTRGKRDSNIQNYCLRISVSHKHIRQTVFCHNNMDGFLLVNETYLIFLHGNGGICLIYVSVFHIVS